MTNYREILRLESLGINHSQIALSIGCTRQTVISVLRKAKQKEIRYSDVANLSDKDIAKAVRGDGGIDKMQFKMPDYERVHKELAKSGVTLSLLWVEYCEECRRSGELPYQVTQFKKYYAEYAKKTGATMHIERKPGESLEVDWAGGHVHVTDADTGEAIPASVFVCALSYSSYAYVEAFWTMEMENWIRAHVNAYEFYGGVTRILIPDNLKTGVTGNTRTETLVNKTYQEMSEHYGTAVIPARVKSPNDKPNAEGAVRTAKTWILAALRNKTFFSLAELNEAIREKLVEHNTRPFQKVAGSRESRYLEELEFLLPLPKHPFELAEWKTAAVAKDYHVRCGQQYYSVPHEYIGRKVAIRVTRNVVEVFYEGLRVCSHPKETMYSGKYVTDEAHMPPAHRHQGQWTGDRFRNWAKKIGPNTLAVIEHLLARAKVEQQSYKTCNALLHLGGKYSEKRLEAACGRVLGFSPHPSFKAVESVLKSESGQSEADKKADKAEKVIQYGFIRGAGYYGDGGDDDDE
jgi:transposase